MANSPKRSQAITHGARVLVVDDDTDGGQAAGILLEAFGCSVSLVGSAAEALECIEEGAERLRDLRPGLPVIVGTGYSSAVEALTDCGAMALMKPYSADVLERVVAERLQVARGNARHPAA